MGFPLVVRAIRLSLEAIDPRLEAAGRTLGFRGEHGDGPRLVHLHDALQRQGAGGMRN